MLELIQPAFPDEVAAQLRAVLVEKTQVNLPNNLTQTKISKPSFASSQLTRPRLQSEHQAYVTCKFDSNRQLLVQFNMPCLMDTMSLLAGRLCILRAFPLTTSRAQGRAQHVSSSNLC
jgi:hypothetical protein